MKKKEVQQLGLAIMCKQIMCTKVETTRGKKKKKKKYLNEQTNRRT
jgi:hypothetical protein